MTNKVYHRSNKNDWGTPFALFEFIERWSADRLERVITLDAAATRKTKLCSRYISQKDNALVIPWAAGRDGIAWCNPPYNLTAQFIYRAVKQAAEYHPSINLIASRTDTLVWHNWIFPHASHIFFLSGRLKFRGAAAGAPFPSAVVVFLHTKKKQIIAPWDLSPKQRGF